MLVYVKREQGVHEHMAILTMPLSDTRCTPLLQFVMQQYVTSSRGRASSCCARGCVETCDNCKLRLATALCHDTGKEWLQGRE